MWRSHTWYEAISRLPAFVYLNRFFHKQLIPLLALLWHFIWWLWGCLFVGVLGNYLYTYFATCTPKSCNISITDPRTWPLIQSHPLLTAIAFILIIVLTLCANLAYRSQQKSKHINEMKEYVLKRVNHLDPHKDIDIFPYNEQVYLSRDADVAARIWLHIAAIKTGGSTEQKLGFCVFGRPGQGKTRLAWETIRNERALAKWTFVKWPHERLHDFNVDAQHGKRFILWLDDLHKFANANEATRLIELPGLFTEVQLVVVATCRDGDNELQARQYLGSLLRRLEEIHLQDLSREEAHELEERLQRIGFQAQSTQFDGTPGSLLLGVQVMKDEQYPTLSKPAKQVLKALKLLHSAGIYLYSTSRVRTVAIDRFSLKQDRENWDEALDELAKKSFIRLGGLAADNERSLEPIEVYLEQAIPDYPLPGADVTDDWPQLQESLTSLNDAFGLNILGLAFNKQKQGNLYDAKQHAKTCFYAALGIYSVEHASMDWATTQNNLGLTLHAEAHLVAEAERLDLLRQAEEAHRAALSIYAQEHAQIYYAVTQSYLGMVLESQAQLVEKEVRLDLLKRAEEAFRTALNVYSSKHTSTEWAGVQAHLGDILRKQASLADRAERVSLVEQAINAYHAALQVYSQTQTPDEWADAQSSLGTALYQQVELVEEIMRPNLLQQATEACRASLQIYSSEHTPEKWARTQDTLGDTLRKQASLADRAESLNLSEQAVNAYRAALQIYSQTQTPDAWVDTQFKLGITLQERAELVPRTIHLLVLKQAEEAYQATLRVYSSELTPTNWALTQSKLGKVFEEQAELVAGAERLVLLKQAEEAYQATLRVYSSELTPTNWAVTQNNLGNVFEDQARLMAGAERLALLKQAEEACKAALRVYSSEYTPTEWAVTQYNYATLYLKFAVLEDNPRGRCTSLKKADQAVKQVLSVLTQETALLFFRKFTKLQEQIKKEIDKFDCMRRKQQRK